MWQRTVAQTAGIGLHPLSTSEDTPYIANPRLKCKSPIKGTPLLPGEAECQHTETGCTCRNTPCHQMEELTSSNFWGSRRSNAHQVCFIQNLQFICQAQTRWWWKQSMFCSPFPFPNPRMPQNKKPGTWPPLAVTILMPVWQHIQQNWGCAVLDPLQTSPASSPDLQSLDFSKQSYNF